MRWCWGVLVLCSVAYSADDLPWWKTAIFYQVYPRSFMDGDGDGVGDLKGIAQVADYFKEIGVDAIWLSPIYQSPMADFGYDISNYTAIDPTFGTMEDFRALVAKLRSIDVKLVLDFVPNHSSDEHPWFQRSVNPNDPLYPFYKDFYVWKDKNGTDDQGNPIPPNNWLSVFGGPSWQWREERQQFYLHDFTVKQPDLNYRDPGVVSNMTAVIEFWLDQGVDGFRMDAVKYCYEDIRFPNEPPVVGTKGDTVDNLQHIYETDQPETFALVKKWADVVYDRVVKDGRYRAIFLEVYDPLQITMRYFGTGNESLSFPFNFQLLGGSFTSRPADLKDLIDQWMASMPDGGVANWVVGNHDNGRVADRYGPEMVDTMNLLTGCLPGIKITYNGEEIGMRDTFIRWDQTVDPSGINLGPYRYTQGSRDPERTPMQWDNSTSAGFSTNQHTWLPVNPNFYWLNVAAQRAAAKSHLKVFQDMAHARQDPILQRGDLNVVVPNEDTLLVVRSYKGEFFALIVNMGSKIATYTSSNLFAPMGLDDDLTVVTTSINSGYKPGFKLEKGALDFTIRQKGAILLKSGTYVPPPQNSSSQLVGTFYIIVLALISINIFSR